VGVARARVAVALVLPRRGLREGGRQHDRHRDGAGCGVGWLSGVEREGVEVRRPVGALAAHAWRNPPSYRYRFFTSKGPPPPPRTSLTRTTLRPFSVFSRQTSTWAALAMRPVAVSASRTPPTCRSVRR